MEDESKLVFDFGKDVVDSSDDEYYSSGEDDLANNEDEVAVYDYDKAESASPYRTTRDSLAKTKYHIPKAAADLLKIEQKTTMDEFVTTVKKFIKDKKLVVKAPDDNKKRIIPYTGDIKKILRIRWPDSEECYYIPCSKLQNIIKGSLVAMDEREIEIKKKMLRKKKEVKKDNLDDSDDSDEESQEHAVPKTKRVASKTKQRVFEAEESNDDSDDSDDSEVEIPTKK